MLPPFKYQEEGAKWLMERGKYLMLCDEMGLGKSRQCIMAADGLGLNKVLVICPTIAKIGWYRQWHEWSSVKREFFVASKISVVPGKDEEHKSIICSYDWAMKNKVYLGREQRHFGVIILDEAHLVKNPMTQRSAGIWGRENGIARFAKRLWFVTGTPAPNHAGELWPVLISFGATKLDYTQFTKKYCTGYNFNGRWTVTGTKKEGIPELKKILEPVMLRRNKDDAQIDLPPLLYQYETLVGTPVDLEMHEGTKENTVTPELLGLYMKQVAEERNLVTGLVERHNLVSDQIVNAVSSIGGSISTLRRHIGLSKVPAYLELVVPELESKQIDKLVIFAVHKDVIRWLEKSLRKYGARSLFGGVDDKTKQEIIDNFMTKKTSRVVICQIRTANTAITLTSAHRIDVLEPDFVPGYNAQAVMRVHRITQTKRVIARFFGLLDSYDQRLTSILKKKTAELTELFDSKKVDEKELTMISYDETINTQTTNSSQLEDILS